MPEAEIGWIAAIIIGGLAGWFAEMFMKSGTGIFMNIVLGIVGAALANWLLSLLGVGLGGWLGYLITGFIGALHHYLPMARCSGTDRLGVILSLTGNRSSHGSQQLLRSRL
jgi:uncharacterized membrane protein YeaQ/YmgE (transglycosylase-associated protein family)